MYFQTIKKNFEIKQDLMGQNKPINFGLHVNNQKNYSFLFLSLYAITCF